MHVSFDKAGQRQFAAKVAYVRVRADMLRRAFLVADIDNRVVAYNDRLGPGLGLVDRIDSGIHKREVARNSLRVRRAGGSRQQGKDQEGVTHGVRCASPERRNLRRSAGYRPADGRKGPHKPRPGYG